MSSDLCWGLGCNWGTCPWQELNCNPSIGGYPILVGCFLWVGALAYLQQVFLCSPRLASPGCCSVWGDTWIPSAVLQLHLYWSVVILCEIHISRSDTLSSWVIFQAEAPWEGKEKVSQYMPRAGKKWLPFLARRDQLPPNIFLKSCHSHLAFQWYLISHNYLLSFLLEYQLSLAMATQFHCLYNCSNSPIFLKLLMNSFYHRPSQFTTEVLIFPLQLCWDPSYPTSPQTRFLAARHPSVPVLGFSDCASQVAWGGSEMGLVFSQN